MKMDFVKLAAVGLLSGFCLSAQSAPDSSEIAMSKCTKEGSAQPDKKCNGNSDCGKCNGNSDCSKCNHKADCSGKSGCSSTNDDTDQQSDASSTMQTKRKVAAQKVVEGE